MKQADDKAWFLNNRHRNVNNSTEETAARRKLADEEYSQKVASTLQPRPPRFQPGARHS